MALIALASAKGSPGATTAALALTLCWSSKVVLAECDPAGGDILAGYLSALEIPPIGLLQLAAAELRGHTADEFGRQVIDLDKKHPGHRLLLPGIADPVQANTVRPTWDRLAEFFAGLDRTEPGYDVLADCGRLSSAVTPWPLLTRADLVLLVVRARSLRTISPALPAASQLRREMTAQGRGTGALQLVLIGDGPYTDKEIAQRLQLPLLAHLPEDRRAAATLTDGTGRLRGSSPLLRAAASAEPRLREALATRRALLGTGEPSHA